MTSSICDETGSDVAWCGCPTHAGIAKAPRSADRDSGVNAQVAKVIRKAMSENRCVSWADMEERVLAEVPGSEGRASLRLLGGFEPLEATGEIVVDYRDDYGWGANTGTVFRRPSDCPELENLDPQSVAAQLLSMIRGGSWPMGDHRRKTQLARALGVTQTSVSQALVRVLGNEGSQHVEHHQGRGWTPTGKEAG